MLQSACTIIHIHSDSQVATRVLPGLAVVRTATRPGTATYVHVSTFGLSVQQQGFVFGFANTETIYADPQDVCFSLELKQADRFFEPSTFSYRSTPKELP